MAKFKKRLKPAGSLQDADVGGWGGGGGSVARHIHIRLIEKARDMLGFKTALS